MAVSYALAAMAALLSALAYAEFMVDLPFAGGAFNCILLTFGELPRLVREPMHNVAGTVFSHGLTSQWGQARGVCAFATGFHIDQFSHCWCMAHMWGMGNSPAKDPWHTSCSAG